MRFKFFRTFGDLHIVDIVGLELQDLLVPQIRNVLGERFGPVTGGEENVIVIRKFGVVVRLLGIFSAKRNFESLSVLRLSNNFHWRIFQSEGGKVLSILCDCTFALDARKI